MFSRSFTMFMFSVSKHNTFTRNAGRRGLAVTCVLLSQIPFGLLAAPPTGAPQPQPPSSPQQSQPPAATGAPSNTTTPINPNSFGGPTPVEKNNSVLVNPGFLFSTGSRAYNAGYGAELSLNWVSDTSTSVGAWTQFQTFGDNARFAGGVQGAFTLFGLELGVSHRDASKENRSVTALHTGIFATVGILGVAFRLDIPVSYGSENLGKSGIDPVLALTVKLPYCVFDQGKWGLLKFWACPSYFPDGM